MIRSFDWRDLALLHRVGDRGLCLDAQLAFTRGPQALQQALLDMITPGRRVATLVARPEEEGEQAAVGQLTHKGSKPYARMLFIGPIDALDHPIGMRLLDALSASAGDGGAQNLIGEVDERSPVFEHLRSAGFAIYARQRIWRLSGKIDQGTVPSDEAWRQAINADRNAIRNLYLNLVPALVQQVEPAPEGNGKGLVYQHERELLGYLDIDQGPLGFWVQPYFHPAAESLDTLLVEFLLKLKNRNLRPIHFCVRSYHGWMNGVLQRLDFEPLGDQAVMVKRLVATVKRPAHIPLPALERTSPEPTVPFARAGEDGSPAGGR